MPALNATASTQRKVLGNTVQRAYTLTGTNGDTFAPPQKGVLWAVGNPTTAIALGITISNDVLTFVTAGAFTATVVVASREG